MPLLKKTREEWQPSENPRLQVGETIMWGDNYQQLVRGGDAVLVDDKGNELEIPGQKFDCPICFSNIEGVMGLVKHISTHLKKNQQAMEDMTMAQNVALRLSQESINYSDDEAKKEQDKKDLEKKLADTRAKRLAVLEKARAARGKKKK